MTVKTMEQPASPTTWAIGWFVAIALGIVSLAGGMVTILDLETTSLAYWGLYSVGLLSPFIASLVYAWQATGSLRPIRAMYLPIRFGAGWLMILALPLSLVLSYIIAGQVGWPVDLRAAQPLSALVVATAGWSAVMWAEETGWRGTLLPVLQARLGPLVATLCIAVLWIVWHIPLLYPMGMNLSTFGFFALQLVGISAIMTWAYNRSQTVLVAVLIHGVYNATYGWLAATIPTMSMNDLLALHALGPLSLGLLLLWVTRGQLGYRRPI